MPLSLLAVICALVPKQCVEDAQGAPLGFVLGTRKGDPNCGNQQAFAPSSDWMPPFMRVNPILDWTYGQVRVRVRLCVYRKKG